VGAPPYCMGDIKVKSNCSQFCPTYLSSPTTSYCRRFFVCHTRGTQPTIPNGNCIEKSRNTRRDGMILLSMAVVAAAPTMVQALARHRADTARSMDENCNHGENNHLPTWSASSLVETLQQYSVWICGSCTGDASSSQVVHEHTGDDDDTIQNSCNDNVVEREHFLEMETCSLATDYASIDPTV